MKSTDLRIGNMVHAYGGSDTTFGNKEQPRFLAKITSLSENSISWGTIFPMKQNYYHNSFEPIVLTQAWLLRFGFTKTPTRFYIGDLDDLNNRDLNLVLCTDKDTICYQDYLHPILYVHQLQNLYYILTGKELCLSEES